MLVDPVFCQLTQEQIDSYVKFFKEQGHDLTTEEVRKLYTPKRIDRGVYVCGLSDFTFLLPDVKMELRFGCIYPLAPGRWYQYPIISNYSINPDGVCDSPEQFIMKMGKILDELPDEYVVELACISKEEQPEQHGWRWEKWGEYIGEQIPQADYLFDEPNIKEVFVFHIYKRVRA